MQILDSEFRGKINVAQVTRLSEPARVGGLDLCKTT